MERAQPAIKLVANRGRYRARRDTVAGRTLINRGFIDGIDTQINAITLNNIDTGCIYGNTLSIAATTVNNDAETVGGVTTAATIAARQRLGVGVAGGLAQLRPG